MEKGSNNQLEAILNTVVDGILSINERGIVEMVNPAGERLFGYPCGEILGKNISFLMPEPYRSEHDQYIRNYLESGQAKIIGTGREVLGLKKNGTTFPMYLAVSEARVDGLRIFTGIVRDLTEQKRAEETVNKANKALQIKANELAEANEEIKNFAYIISHDLRAPLVNIMGFSKELKASMESIDSALDELPSEQISNLKNSIDPLKEDIQESFQFIDSSVNRMDTLIGAVLKLSRLGRKRLDFQPIAMNELAQKIMESLAHQIESNRVEINMSQLPEVHADSTAMEQIVGNLLVNAINYADPERVCKIDISGNRVEEKTVFQISDTGRGIAEHDLEKIFDIFRRGGKEDVPGEGMGLTYVKTLVQRHGGTIKCESELGVGTTFIFTISNNLT